MLILLTANIQAQEIVKKPDFVQKDKNGKITGKGVYTTDDSGYVIRYDFSDASGKLQYYNIPYYARDGRLLEIRNYDSAGKLLEVVVYINNKVVGLDSEGKRITKYDNTTMDMEAFLKHFRNKK